MGWIMRSNVFRTQSLTTLEVQYYTRVFVTLCNDTTVDHWQDADKVEDHTKATKQKAGELKEKTDKLDVEVRRLDEKLNMYQEQAGKDKNISRMALEKAEQAKTNAKTASQKVAEGLAKVDEIRRDLNRLDRIDVKELERLEKRYREVEMELLKSGLEETLGDFRTAISLQVCFS